MTAQPSALLFRIRAVTLLFIIGLVLSGLTAIPLQEQADALVKWTGAAELVARGGAQPPEWAAWLVRVQAGLRRTAADNPWLYYGTDWLAFAHIVIAVAFIGAWRDPVRNVWLFQFGLIACALVIPWAVAIGGWRGIPWWWRAMDCSFGLGGAIPLWLCLKWTRQLAGKS